MRVSGALCYGIRTRRTIFVWYREYRPVCLVQGLCALFEHTGNTIWSRSSEPEREPLMTENIHCLQLNISPCASSIVPRFERFIWLIDGLTLRLQNRLLKSKGCTHMHRRTAHTVHVSSDVHIYEVSVRFISRNVLFMSNNNYGRTRRNFVILCRQKLHHHVCVFKVEK